MIKATIRFIDDVPMHIYINESIKDGGIVSKTVPGKDALDGVFTFDVAWWCKSALAYLQAANSTGVANPDGVVFTMNSDTYHLLKWEFYNTDFNKYVKSFYENWKPDASAIL